MAPSRRRLHLGLVITALFLGAAGLTCRAPSPHDPTPDRHGDRRTPLDEGRNRHLPPLPHDLPRATDPTPVPQIPSYEQLPPRWGAAGSTRGTISCGEVRCYAPREVCIWVIESNAWACLPAAEVPETNWIRFACDDSSDCQNGTTCCRGFDLETSRSACRPAGECIARLCDGGDGAPCPAGQSCKTAVCAPDKPPPATCDGKKPCPNDKPVCVWNDTEGQCVDEKKAAEMLAAHADQEGLSVRRCTRPADCAPGFRCCESSENGLWTSECSLQCRDALRTDYCNTDADCAGNGDGLTSCRKARASGEAAMPPWSRRCNVPPEPQTR